MQRAAGHPTAGTRRVPCRPVRSLSAVGRSDGRTIAENKAGEKEADIGTLVPTVGCIYSPFLCTQRNTRVLLVCIFFHPVKNKEHSYWACITLPRYDHFRVIQYAYSLLRLATGFRALLLEYF